MKNNAKTPEQKIEWNAKSVTLLAVLIIVSTGVIFFAGTSLDKSDLDTWLKRSAEWKATEGQITELAAYRMSGSRLHDKGGIWNPIVKYVYFVDGAKVTGETIGRPTLAFGSEEETKQYLTNFKILSKVTVYYDPKMVTQSCLVKGEKLTVDTKIPQRD